MLSEKKAINSLKPWWDVAFHYSLMALLTLAMLMLLVTSGFGQGQFLSIRNEPFEADGSDPGIRTTRVRKNGQIDLVVRSRFIPDDPGQPANTSHNKTRGDREEPGVTEQSSFRGRGNPPAQDDKQLRMRRSIMDMNMTNSNIDLIDGQDRGQDVANAVSTLVILFVVLLFEVGVNKVFYSNHLMQSLVHLISILSDVREFNKTNHGLIFANTLHHANNRSSLWTLFWMKNLIRAILSIAALSMAAHFHLSGITSLSNSSDHVKFSIAILMILLIVGVLGLSLYGLAWPWIVALSSWGQLMQKYSESLNKIDIARGRCVPMPSAMIHSSRFSLMASPLQMLSTSNMLPKRASFSRTSIERIVDALNPYTASPNIRLILDMVAYKSGVGVALRNLAFLEIDVHNNWRPFRPQLTFVIDSASSDLSLEVSWKDPLAILYLNPVPKELQLHYGIEIIQSDHDDTDKLVEIVGYQESRYFRQIWHYHRSSSIEDSTLTLSHDSAQNNITNEPFVYRECFSSINPPKSGSIKVCVWTIIDGQLIAKSTVSYLSDPSGPPPKPPRSRSEDEKSSEQNGSDGGKTEDEIPVEQKQLNILVSSVTEVPQRTFHTQVNKVSSEAKKPPRRPCLVRQDEVDLGQLSSKAGISARRNFLQSRAKSLTNLKHEIRRSLKRKHRLSGEQNLDPMGHLKKSTSMGNTLPFKSRDDFPTFNSKVPVRYTDSNDSEDVSFEIAKSKSSSGSGESNEAFEQDSSTEHII